MLLRSSRLLGLGLVFLEDCLDRSIALGGAFSVEAHAGDAKRLGIGIPSNLGSALALPANELVAFLSGDSRNIKLLVANLILVAIEDNGACTVIGERTLVRVNGEGHVEVLLRSSRLLNLLEGIVSHAIVEEVSVGLHVGKRDRLARVKGLAIVGHGVFPAIAFACIGGINALVIINNGCICQRNASFCINPVNGNLLMLASGKCCKRHAHNNHKSGRQQSQQTSFKSRFLHVISPIH